MGPLLSDDDFEFDCIDEEAFDELTTTAPTNAKRSHHDDNGESPSAKRQKRPDLALKILRERFQIDSFRLKQAEAIDRILSGDSAVVVFPTGGGKSLCYQVPAVAFRELDKADNSRSPEEAGITLVISPLIALMKDQVDALLKKGIHAAVLDSTKTRDEFLKIHDDLRHGKLDLLYCAPERLNNEGFLGTLQSIRGGIRLLAVDEAHCISEWGHSFRPDYLKIRRFAKEVKVERVVCLTATATSAVAQDICKAFDIPPSGLFTTSVYRPNLHLLAEPLSDDIDPLPTLVSFLKKRPGPSVVYVTKQESSEVLASQLTREKFLARAYHAGLPKEVRASVQEDFMRSKSMIVVCTIAFGMGIDKPDIRNIVHFDLPSSIEAYSQQIGRAGRDGRTSTCMLFVSNKDFHMKNVFIFGDCPSNYALKTLFEDLQTPENLALRDGDTMEVNLQQQSKIADIKSTQLNIIYAQLELKFNLFRAGTPLYAEYQYKVKSPQQMASDKSPAADAIRKKSTTSRIWTRVDVEAASSFSGIPRQDIVRKLDAWDESDTIELQKKAVRNVFHLRRKLPTGTEAERIIKDLRAEMDHKTEQGLERLQDVRNLITSKGCFPKKLADYFGDKTVTFSECGNCTWCKTHKQVTLPEIQPQKPDQTRLQHVLKACDVRDDPQFLASFAFGIKGPRVTALKLGKDPAFESMADCDFKELVKAFAKVCS